MGRLAGGLLAVRTYLHPISGGLEAGAVIEVMYLSKMKCVGYRGIVAQRFTIVAKRRPEDEVPRRWGLYVVDEERWLPVLFVNASEAEEAVRLLNGQQPTAS